jgi:hypothetical protein
VTLLNGAITTADNSALCYLQRVPMKGYVIKEMCMFDSEPSSAKAAHGQLFRNLRELVTLTSYGDFWCMGDIEKVAYPAD